MSVFLTNQCTFSKLPSAQSLFQIQDGSSQTSSNNLDSSNASTSSSSDGMPSTTSQLAQPATVTSTAIRGLPNHVCGLKFDTLLELIQHIESDHICEIELAGLPEPTPYYNGFSQQQYQPASLSSSISSQQHLAQILNGTWLPTSCILRIMEPVPKTESKPINIVEQQQTAMMMAASPIAQNLDQQASQQMHLQQQMHSMMQVPSSPQMTTMHTMPTYQQQTLPSTQQITPGFQHLTLPPTSTLGQISSHQQQHIIQQQLPPIQQMSPIPQQQTMPASPMSHQISMKSLPPIQQLSTPVLQQSQLPPPSQLAQQIHMQQQQPQQQPIHHHQQQQHVQQISSPVPAQMLQSPIAQHQQILVSTTMAQVPMQQQINPPQHMNQQQLQQQIPPMQQMSPIIQQQPLTPQQPPVMAQNPIQTQKSQQQTTQQQKPQKQQSQQKKEQQSTEPAKIYTCPNCPKKYKTQRGLKTHQNTHHSSAATNPAST